MKPGIAWSVLVAGLLCPWRVWSQSEEPSKLDRTLDVSVDAGFGRMNLGGVEMHPTMGDEAPAVLRDTTLRARNWGWVGQGMFHMGWSMDRIRFGWGLGSGAIDGLRWERRGSEVEGNTVLSIPLEAFVGYTPKVYWALRPYVDARVRATFLLAKVRTQELGEDLGTTSYGATVWGFGPRVGVRIPINVWLFADCGASIGLVGPESLLITAGLGLPIPTSHL